MYWQWPGLLIFQVAVHEIGHVLGLLHNDHDHSIMYPIYINPQMYEDFELARDDRRAVQNIYGVCKACSIVMPLLLSPVELRRIQPLKIPQY